MISHALNRQSSRQSARSRTANRRRGLIALEGLEDRRLLSGTWTGGGGNNYWSNPANWSSNTVPTQYDNVTLSGSQSVVLTANAVAQSLTVADTASLDLKGFTLSVNANPNIAVAAGFTQSGGTVNDSVGGSTIVVGGNFTNSAGAFSVPNVTFTGVTASTVDSGLTFNNVTIAYAPHHLTIAAGQPLNVTGLLTITGYNTITGDINAYGNVNTTAPYNTQNASTGTIHFKGSAPQTLSGTGNAGALPRVSNEKTGGGVLTVTGSITPEGWTQVSGNLAAAGSTTTFTRTVGGASSNVNTGTTKLGDVIVQAGVFHFWVTKMNVGGNLTINSAQSFQKGTGAPASGVITVEGDLTSNDTSLYGPVDIWMVGTRNATITANPGDFPDGGITINKGSAQTVTANVTQALDGPLTLSSMSSLIGTFAVGGNVTTTDTSVGGNVDGPAVLLFQGNKAQTLTAGAANGMVPGLAIDKNGGSLTLANNSNTLQVSGGWVVAPTNTAPVNLTGTTVRFMLNGGYGHRTIDTGGSAGFNNAEIQAGSGANVTIGAMKVNGNLTLASANTINGGNIKVYGNVTATGATAMIGSSRVYFVGTNDQTLSATANNRRMIGVIIEKTGGKLTIDPTYTIDVTGNWDYIGEQLGDNNGKDVVATGSTIRFVGPTKYLRPGKMVFGNVDFAVGSADHVEVLLGAGPGVLYHSGTITNGSKVTVGYLNP